MPSCANRKTACWNRWPAPGLRPSTPTGFRSSPCWLAWARRSLCGSRAWVPGLLLAPQPRAGRPRRRRRPRPHHKQSDFGGYLELLLDFVVYLAVPIAFVAAEANVLHFWAGLALLASFVLNAVSWTTLSAVLEKRRQASQRPADHGIEMPGGLIEGAETVVFYTLFFLFPAYTAWLFLAMAALVLVTVAQRLWWAYQAPGAHCRRDLIDAPAHRLPAALGSGYNGRGAPACLHAPVRGPPPTGVSPMPNESLLLDLRQAIPAERLLLQPAQLAPYESDALTAYHARPAAVVLAGTQEDVIAAVRACRRHGVPFVAHRLGTPLGRLTPRR